MFELVSQLKELGRPGEQPPEIEEIVQRIRALLGEPATKPHEKPWGLTRALYRLLPEVNLRRLNNSGEAIHMRPACPRWLISGRNTCRMHKGYQDGTLDGCFCQGGPSWWRHTYTLSRGGLITEIIIAPYDFGDRAADELNKLCALLGLRWWVAPHKNVYSPDNTTAISIINF